MQVNPSIFKAYDIRGVYGTDLNEEIAYQIGRGFAFYIKTSPIIVGYDTRISSPALKDSLIKGLTDQGADVIDIGLCSTSCFYYTAGNPKFAGGIMVTASHASKEFNGFKPVFKNNVPLTREQILELKDVILKNQFPTSEKKGTVTTMEPNDDYIKTVKNTIKEKIKPLKVIMDAGNGMAGLYIEKVFSDIGLNLIPTFTELDGNFPNHETNPKLPENRVKLVEKILEEKADLGFMFDGDADRLYVLDRKGEPIDPSLVLAIISEYMIKNSDKKKIVVDVRASKVVRHWTEKAGGNFEVSVCWTIPIKLKMQAEPEIVFGGETSAHYVFPKMHEADDGILAALTFLQAISVKEESIDEINNKFKQEYFVLEEQNFKMHDAEEISKILKKLKNKYEPEGAQILEIDGLSVIFPEWAFNLRKSESEPLIRLNFEASSKKIFDERKEEIVKLIKET